MNLLSDLLTDLFQLYFWLTFTSLLFGLSTFYLDTVKHIVNYVFAFINVLSDFSIGMESIQFTAGIIIYSLYNFADMNQLLSLTAWTYWIESIESDSFQLEVLF